jgi:D-3-phosphoglycerate dehydrogenase
MRGLFGRIKRMSLETRVAVCSRSFSRNKVLRAELLQRFAHVTFNDTGRQLEGDDLVEFLRGHDKAITALERIDDYVLSHLPELKVIGKYGVGLDMIDMAAMRAHGKRLGWSGGVNRRSVSELVIAFAIAMLRHVPAANREILSGTWQQHVGGQLSGRTVGIIGCGHVGKDLVQLLQPFGCRILVNDIIETSGYCNDNAIQMATKDEIYQTCDIVSLHVPLTEDTRGMIDLPVLKQMKATAFLVNTSRGMVVRQDALKEALMSGLIAGAALDVYEEEPPADSDFLRLPNLICTPHIGGNSCEAVRAMGMSAIGHLAGYFGVADAEATGH